MEIIVCNGEIYGFERIKKQLLGKYSFKSDSDREIPLPLYEEYGTDMFAMLDAEFACILYDSKTQEYIAARDPIGIRPLYYGRDSKGVMAFASEPKNLVGLCENIIPFPPGHFYKDGKFVCYCDIAKAENYSADDMETVCQKIHDKLTAGIEKRLVTMPRSAFFCPAVWILPWSVPWQRKKARFPSAPALACTWCAKPFMNRLTSGFAYRRNL